MTQDAGALLADQIDRVLTEYLNATNPAIKECEAKVLRDILWDNKAGIVAHLRQAASQGSAGGEAVAWRWRHPAWEPRSWIYQTDRPIDPDPQLIIEPLLSAALSPPVKTGGGERSAVQSETLEALIREYAHDLRRNSSGGDLSPDELRSNESLADYLEELIRRASQEFSPVAKAEVRSEDAALREWRDAVLGCCKACDGFDSLQWGGDKSGWGFIMFFVSHLNTRALHAESVLAEQDLSRAAAQASIGPREVLDALADKVAAKIGQLEHYKANDCQLDHARTIAEGRISQANQILHWIAEAAVSHSPSVPSADRGGGK